MYPIKLSMLSKLLVYLKEALFCNCIRSYFFTKKKVSTPSQLVSPDSKFNLQRKQCEVSSLLLFTQNFYTNCNCGPINKYHKLKMCSSKFKQCKCPGISSLMETLESSFDILPKKTFHPQINGCQL